MPPSEDRERGSPASAFATNSAAGESVRHSLGARDLALPLFLVALFAAGYRTTPALADPPPPPVVTVPETVTAEPQSRNGAVFTFDASATDWRAQSLAVGCEPPSGSLFPLGSTTVSCAATDRRGRSTSATFVLKVEHLYLPAEGAAVRPSRRVTFAWYPIKGARRYNLQLWRRGAGGWRKVASVFPTRQRFILQTRWSYDRRPRRLVRGGDYLWYVWPWFGSRYGSLLGQNAFLVR